MNNSREIVTGMIAAFSVFPVVELFFFLPVMSKINQLNMTAQKAIRVLSSKSISDHWKEKVIQRYSLHILSVSLLLLFFIVLLLVLFVFVFCSLSLLAGAPFSSAIQNMISVKIQLIALVAALVYGVVRRRMMANV